MSLIFKKLGLSDTILEAIYFLFKDELIGVFMQWGVYD